MPGHYVKVAPGKSNIQLPNGNSYNAGQTVLLNDTQYSQLSPTAISGGSLLDLGQDEEGQEVMSFPVTLTALPAAGDVLTELPMTFAGRMVATAFIVTTPVVAAGKSAVLNMEIGLGVAGVNVVGGLISLTSANCTPLGKVIPGSAVTASNQFNGGDVISIESTVTAAFTEGAGVLMLTVAPHG